MDPEVLELSREQRRAGREHLRRAREHLDELNRSDPPGGWPPPEWAVYRHDCPQLGISAGITLRARTLTSDDGLFTFTWKEGRCNPCGLMVRSRRGDMPPPADPTAGERQASAHPGDPGQPRA